jgi:SAM-dependent methyltransferase
VLAGRPLLDIGTGDGQTLAALAHPDGLRIGIDRTAGVLAAARRSGIRDVIAALADSLPLLDGSVRTVLAGDVFHHMADDDLRVVLAEIRRVLAPDGVLVGWWYETSGRGGPDDPRFPRAYELMAEHVSAAGLVDVQPLALESMLEPSPPTVGLRASR